MERLTSEIAKVDAFYSTRLRNSQATFNLLEESAGSGAPANDLASRDLQNRLVKFYVELTALREYASLNYTAVTKIVKKHDKYAPVKIAATFRTDLNSRPVFGTLEEVHTLLARTRVCLFWHRTRCLSLVLLTWHPCHVVLRTHIPTTRPQHVFADLFYDGDRKAAEERLDEAVKHGASDGGFGARALRVSMGDG